MIRRPPRSTRTDTLFPYTTLFRSKPGGTALFLEHGGAPDAGVARWQRRIEPVWKRIGGNCHLTRPIADAYSAAGFAVDRRGAHYMPKTPRPFGWIRSEERGVGKECVSRGKSWWSPVDEKKKLIQLK